MRHSHIFYEAPAADEASGWSLPHVIGFHVRDVLVVTHAAGRSVCGGRRVLGLNTPNEPFGRCSTCSPGSSGLRCRSKGIKENIPEHTVFDSKQKVRSDYHGYSYTKIHTFEAKTFRHVYKYTQPVCFFFYVSTRVSMHTKSRIP